jgi:hypothetical protein
MSRVEAGIQAVEQVAPTVRDDDLRKLERDGYAVMAGFMAFGEASETGRMAKIVHGAQLLVIAFAFITPVLLFWKVAL